MKYLVDFKNTVSDSDIRTYLLSNNCEILKEWSNYDKVFLVESANSPPATDIVESVIEDSSLTIKPLQVLEIDRYHATHSDPDLPKINIQIKEKQDWWKNYSFAYPEFDNDVLTINRLGTNIKVYVMDSGINDDHPEFVDANIEHLYTVTPGNYKDRKGHGTAIASVIVGKNCGITSASVKNVKIFDPDHATLQSEFLNALDAIIEDHEDNTIAVLNCSWAIEKNPWVEHKLRALVDEGVWIVCSAGNNGTSIENVTPASMYEVITVGSYNQDLVPCDFSNYTDESIVSLTKSSTNYGELDGWAPGQDIWVAGLNNSYGYVSGTSISAAITSAVIASNCHYYVDADGKRRKGNEGWELSTINSYVQALLVFSRENILDLSNEKYQSSKNIIVSIFDYDKVIEKYPVDEFVAYQRVGQRGFSHKIFATGITKQIEIIDSLPQGWEVLPTGFLYGDTTQDIGPVEGEQYRIYNSTVKRTFLDGKEELVKIKIYIMQPNLQSEDLPDDHELKINLQSISCSGPLYSSCGPVVILGTACINNCGNGSCCAGLSPSPFPKGANYGCFCASDIRLKSNIEKIGEHKLGIGLYEYTLFDKRTTGVMAHEVRKVMPEAVRQDLNGYYYVNYCMIDR
jgi:hypothetical protein